MTVGDFEALKYLAPKIKGGLTGRETLYHGTSDQNAKDILENGVQPKKKPGIASMLNGVDDTGVSYMTPKKANAATYAAQSSNIETKIRELEGALGRKATTDEITQEIKKYASSDDRKLAGSPFAERPGKVLKASVPTWDLNAIKNPELEGFNLLNWGDETIRRGESVVGRKFTPLERFMAKALAPVTHTVLGNERSFKGGVPSKYFLDSPNFEGLTGGEWLRYAKKKPHHLAGGVGALAGTALAGYDLFDRIFGGDK